MPLHWQVLLSVLFLVGLFYLYYYVLRLNMIAVPPLNLPSGRSIDYSAGIVRWGAAVVLSDFLMATGLLKAVTVLRGEARRFNAFYATILLLTVGSLLLVTSLPWGGYSHTQIITALEVVTEISITRIGAVHIAISVTFVAALVAVAAPLTSDMDLTRLPEKMRDSRSLLYLAAAILAAHLLALSALWEWPVYLVDETQAEALRRLSSSFVFGAGTIFSLLLFTIAVPVMTAQARAANALCPDEVASRADWLQKNDLHQANVDLAGRALAILAPTLIAIAANAVAGL